MIGRLEYTLTLPPPCSTNRDHLIESPAVESSAAMEPLFLIIVCVIFWLVWRVLRFITNNATLGDALNAVGIRVFPMTDVQRQRVLDLLEKIGENDPASATFEGKKFDELDRDEADQLIKYLKDRLYGGGARVLTFRGRKRGDP